MTLQAIEQPVATDLRAVIQRAQWGEQAAYHELFERHKRPLRRLVQARIGLELGQHLEAEDVVQETFLAAFQALDRHEFRSDAAYYGWLTRIAARKLQDAVRFYRREKRTPQADYFAEGARGSQQAEVSLAAESAAGSGDPLEELEQRELGRLATRCLRLLKPELRAVVVWREMHDEPWHRIAERLGRRTIGAARHLHGIACGELARHMKA